jgi:EmrB/QacA subfamily drug resistance transporter
MTEQPASSVTLTQLSAAKRKEFRAAFLCVAPSMFLGSVDQTIIAAALPVVARAFGGFTYVAWVVTGYLLTATIAAPIYGRLGDAYGRRKMLLWSLAFFLAGSVACAAAPTLFILVAGRCVQGFGGGGLMTLSQALIGEVVSPKERGRFQGWFGAVFALASTIGPLAGGFMAQYLGWRSIFWINLPLGILAALTALRLKSANGAGNYKTDYRGMVLFVLGTLCLLLLLSFGGHGLAWLSGQSLGLVTAFLLCFGLLWIVEQRCSAPLLPPRLLMNAVVWRLTLIVLLFASVLFGLIVQLPVFLQAALGVSVSASGLLLIPLTAAQVLVSTITGLRISSTGKPRNAMLYGLATVTVGFAVLLAVLHAGSALIAAVMLLIGAGLGSTMPAAQTMVQWASGERDLGEATAILSFSRSIGGVLGTAVTSTILLAAVQMGGKIASLTNSTKGVHGHHPSAALSLGFLWMFSALGILSLAAALITWSLPNIDLSQDPSGRSGNAS